VQKTATPNPAKSFINWVSFVVAIAVSIPWSWCAVSGVHPSEPIVATLAGLSVLGAAFVLSWIVDAAEIDMPPALAVSILALIAVLPEYAVDATFAWKAATDPKQAQYAIANMTGGNRLLLGLGWSTLVLLSWMRFGKPAIRLPETARTDITILLLASAYAIVPVTRGALTLFDMAVFVFLYGTYIVAAIRVSTPDEDHELVGPAALLDAFGTWPRRLGVLFLFVWSATMIFLAAEPFAESLVHTGLEMGIDEFLLVQWVAPLASESPEFVIAWLLVLRGHMSKGLVLLVSSKVNQWTLLVGTLPLVTSVSAGEPMSLVLDPRQQAEVLLTAAQTFFGVAIIADMHLKRSQAMMLAVLFLGQMVVAEARAGFTVVYVMAAVGIMIINKRNRTSLVLSFKTTANILMGRNR
jgi:cation:H+ antiporter